MRHAAVNPALSTAHSPPTLAVQADVHDAVLDLHVPAQVSLEVELAGAVRALEWLAACVQVHMTQQVVHAVEGLPAHLALERLHRRVHNHVGLEGLLLHEGLEADVALVGPDAGVDQHVALHVGLQRELPATDLTLELLHTLWEQRDHSGLGC